MDKLYTLLLDYDGGTYISQSKGVQLQAVFNEWIETYDFSKIETENGNYQIESVDTDLSPIEGLKNVWCTTFYIANKLALVHIVETAL